MALSDDQHVARKGFDARASVVNRTHRIVRARAVAMQARKRTVRDLIVPFAICSTILLLIATAVWSLGDEGLAEFQDGVGKRILELGGDAGNSISIVLVWFLPLSVITAAIVMLRRSRNQDRNDEVQR
ncbi:hypothetical protein Terro_3968 [Terriglobus roseus DSM 18391]|uniref:Uncharacterized protein n=1 Tax=Terriglobus roseus (strain DSM 18391 / NRRL B-41598 / KBS 63) TaxID=926566 RepID=I3ZLQ8_TERRK|nr:hypothetical protein [Terriglobus roseus]AFL90176.1 hypothetical protein Terro_3968 [Terriglobus roseus DSM 18391]